MVKKLYVIAVAPHTGAWIETPMPEEEERLWQVAPHTGAWIETLICQRSRQLDPRRSPYGSVD